MFEVAGTRGHTFLWQKPGRAQNVHVCKRWWVRLEKSRAQLPRALWTVYLCQEGLWEDFKQGREIMRFELLGASGKRETRWLSVFGNGWEDFVWKGSGSENEVNVTYPRDISEVASIGLALIGYSRRVRADIPPRWLTWKTEEISDGAIHWDKEQVRRNALKAKVISKYP